jgi:hypothetical protein
MDEIVIQSMLKWPNVPACFGWLGLSSRGDWFLRDDLAQSKGSFVQSKGSKLQHRKLIEFINRNYQCNELGCYYFQNGPQKVFVELETAPYILRVQNDSSITTHTGLGFIPVQCFVDEQGRVYLQSETGLGIVHTLDMNLIVDQILDNKLKPIDTTTEKLEARFKFIKSPKEAQKQKSQ